MVERESDEKLVKNHSEVPDLKQEGLRILRNMEEERALSRGQRFLYGPVGFETFEENLSEGFQNTVGNWQSGVHRRSQVRKHLCGTISLDKGLEIWYPAEAER